MKPPVYLGAFLTADSRRRLLEACPPKHGKVYADHVTIKFAPKPADVVAFKVHTALTLRVIREVSDALCQAVVVVGVDTANAHAHITISTAAGTKPVYSNQLCENSVTTVQKDVALDLEAVLDTFPRSAV